MSYLYELLESIRVVISLVFLSYASWHDYRSREISNRVWVFYAPLGLTLTLLQIFATNQSSLIVLALSFVVLTGMTFALFYIGFFGGADVMAFICLSLALPFELVSFKPLLGVVSPIYSISIFGNAVLASAVTAVGILLYNILCFTRTSGGFFEGLEDEPINKKILALLTGYKIELSTLKRKLFLAPMEELSRGDDGRIVHRLRLFKRTDVEREASVAKLEEFRGDLQKIWVTPYLPYIVFITIGLVMTLFVGDIMFWLVRYLIN